VPIAKSTAFYGRPEPMYHRYPDGLLIARAPAVLGATLTAASSAKRGTTMTAAYTAMRPSLPSTDRSPPGPKPHFALIIFANNDLHPVCTEDITCPRTRIRHYLRVSRQHVASTSSRPSSPWPPCALRAATCAAEITALAQRASQTDTSLHSTRAAVI